MIARVIWILAFITCTLALTNSVAIRSQLLAELQKCVTPEDVLEAVSDVSPTIDPNLASLVLVRLSKQLVGRANSNTRDLLSDLHVRQVRQVAAGLAMDSSTPATKNLEALTEGTKAHAVLSRLLQSSLQKDPVIQFWHDHSNGFASQLEPHQLSGLKWAFDTFHLLNEDTAFPSTLRQAYNDLKLPFCIIPGCLQDLEDLSVEKLASEVEFRVDDIRTSSNKVVKERRKTEWQGDDSCGPFVYSNKSMPRSDWSSVVKQVRDRLNEVTDQYYDGCLLNLYPDGQSGMRYHVDPDQGALWDYDTAVVSIGAIRKFAFRAIAGKQQPHSFLVMHGDVSHMFGDCQERFQHTVKKADNRNDDSARASLVFKRTWNHESTMLVQ
jgi:alkylated DNA repair dioxygenase AlkB